MPDLRERHLAAILISMRQARVKPLDPEEYIAGKTLLRVIDPNHVVDIYSR